MLKGIGVSSGVVEGKAYLVERQKISAPQYYIEKSKTPNEIKRLERAIALAREQIKSAHRKVDPQEGRDIIYYILDAQLMILKDDMLIRSITDHIEKDRINAEWALEKVLKRFGDIFNSLEDKYLQEKKNDIDYVGERLLRNLMGREQETISQIQDEVILVAHDFSPADTAQMAKGKILGFATDMGSRISHTAIMARSLEIPAVVGLENVTEYVKTGDFIVVDGLAGEVIINPTSVMVSKYKEKERSYRFSFEELLKSRDLSAETRDGFRVKLKANIELIEEVPSIREHGAEGIGLYRTEFLYLNRKKPPSEEEHFRNYREAVENVAPHSATIRTLDLGGDKYASQIELAEELRSSPGLRAIRLCLKDVDLFKTQLRGMLRASAYGKLKIMLPMISEIKELHQTKEILEEVKDELRTKGIPFDDKIQLGIMIETPSASLTADILAPEVDFFSIGTNDLIQYSMAIDRVNEHVAYLYDPFHPAILRLIKRVVAAAKESKIKVGICGEMAGEEIYLPILLGLGLEELSMNSISIPRVKKIIRSITYKEARELVERASALKTAAEVEGLVRNDIKRRFPEINYSLKEEIAYGA
ncbi:MAG: phosphoenolpyruvate--protein phosphotransferase [Deltaproteobacteria bacterium]|nr:MAG: phosphoenolpyruvate--protein phosphotransferase [Deltaproteobacteria bacterium]